MEADNHNSDNSEGQRPERITRRQAAPQELSIDDTNRDSMDTSLSNSYPCTSHGNETKKRGKAVVAIDWLELAGCVMWSEIDSRETFIRLFQCQSEARQINQSIIYNVADYACLLRPTGLGSGRQARQTYVLDTPFGLLAFSDRDDSDRKLPNFYFKVPGEKCLNRSATECREFAHRVVRELGGMLVDEWVRRIDIAIDLPDLNIRSQLVKAFRHQHFTTSAKYAHEYQIDRKRTGFKVGAKNSVALIAYDKREEVMTKGPEYLLGMVQKRWGGSLPQHATRVELQIAGAWLSQFGDRKADDILGGLSPIVDKLLGEERPWFRLTKTKPDRENNHQTRAETLPAWKRITRRFIKDAGLPGEKLERRKPPLKRININDPRGLKTIQCVLGRSAGRRGHQINDFEDIIDELRDLNSMNPDLEHRWQEKWRLAAIDAGTYIKPADIPF